MRTQINKLYELTQHDCEGVIEHFIKTHKRRRNKDLGAILIEPSLLLSLQAWLESNLAHSISIDFIMDDILFPKHSEIGNALKGHLNDYKEWRIKKMEEIFA